MDEIDRAVKDLRLRGIQVHSDIAGKPLDSPEFMPVYEKMAYYDLPIFIHPVKEETVPDYPGEETFEVPCLEPAQLATPDFRGHAAHQLQRHLGALPEPQVRDPSRRRHCSVPLDQDTGA